PHSVWHPSRSYYVLQQRRPPPRSPLFPYTTLFRSESPSRNSRRPPDRLSRRSSAVSRNGRRCGWRDRRIFRELCARGKPDSWVLDRKSTRLNSSHEWISYAVFCLKKKIEV